MMGALELKRRMDEMRYKSVNSLLSPSVPNSSTAGASMRKMFKRSASLVIGFVQK